LAPGGSGSGLQTGRLARHVEDLKPGSKMTTGQTTFWDGERLTMPWHSQYKQFLLQDPHMKYIRKIFSLGRSGVRKLIFLLTRRFDLIEVRILLLGLILSCIAVLYLCFLLFADPSLYRVLSSTAIIHIMGGRALGVAMCLSADIPLFYTILYNFFLEVVIVLITYGVVVMIMRNVIQPKLFRSTVRQAELTAQKQKTRIKKYGAIGLFLFVMFPFFMTGPVIGSIIGYLLNYKAVNNFLIVFGGTLSSIIIYALVGNNIIKFLGRYIDVDLTKKWSAIIIGALIVIFLFYHIKTVKALLDGQDDAD
jgi:uncharacterized membrane protein